MKPFAVAATRRAAQEAVRRARPVRRLQDQDGAAPRGGGFEFVNDIFGGSIPRNFIPAVEKGIVEAAAKGFLAGFPVVDFRVILYDGSYHDVDSSEIAFKSAGPGLQEVHGTSQACTARTDHECRDHRSGNSSGDIMGNLNSRRGRIQGMDTRAARRRQGASAAGGNADLRLRPYLHDPGPRDLHMEMDHYDFVPRLIRRRSSPPPQPPAASRWKRKKSS